MTLLPHQSDNSLAIQFVSFFFLFHSKIKNIWDMFSVSAATVAPPMDLPPNLSNFVEVSENGLIKIIKNSHRKSCLLVPSVDSLLPLITKLVNLSLFEGVFP